jgi:hypothetical protein
MRVANTSSQGSGTVVANGRLLDRATLDRLLAAVERDAR